MAKNITNIELKIYYTVACQGMSTLKVSGAGGCGIATEWMGNTGGSGTINVSLCTTGGCLGGCSSCDRLMNGLDIL